MDKPEGRWRQSPTMRLCLNSANLFANVPRQRQDPSIEPRVRVLVIRLSALGDVVQALPALTDLRRAFPLARIDVATDERFADIPALHSGVDRVIGIALKRWKRSLFQRQTWQELRAALRSLRAERYELVLDLHGLNKSAIVARLARAKHRLGPGAAHCGEPLAPRLYGRTLNPPLDLAPVPRMRELAALASGHPLCEPPDYGLRVHWTGQASDQVVLLHGTSATHKQWAESNWVALGQDLAAQGMRLLLPWGGADEHARALRLAEGIGAAHCQVGSAQTVAEWARQLAGCRLVVGLDTGLTHLAAAAGVPCLALFVTTNPVLFAPQCPPRATSLGGSGLAPALADVQAAARQLLGVAERSHDTGSNADGGTRPTFT